MAGITERALFHAYSVNYESATVREARRAFERAYEQATPEERERMIEEWSRRDHESRRQVER